MKRHFLMFAVISIMIFSAASVFAEGVILKVASAEGEVLVMAPGAADWAAAAVGQAVNPKDSIKTGGSGKAVLVFQDGSSFTIKPNSQMMVEDIVWNNVSRKVNVNLSAGELKTIIQKVGAPSEFKVKTPTAICGARSTIFYVAVFADGTSVYVDEGSVDFLNSVSYESYTIVQGMTADAMSNGTVTPPRELTPDEKAALLTSWGVTNVPVAEQYTEPPADNPPTDPMTDDTATPEVVSEEPASAA
jgi:hypothetical protein